jgi:hypothetical protein
VGGPDSAILKLMDHDERQILDACDAAVRSAIPAIEPIVAAVKMKLREHPGDVLAWESIPLERYSEHLPESIRSSWVFVLRANVSTTAERHPIAINA